jgi:hypothetical protein
MTPERVFQVLLVAGVAAGGWLYGDYWKKNGLSQDDQEGAAELRAQNSELTRRLDELTDELAQVRSILKSGPYPVSDADISWVEEEHAMVFRKPPNVRLASPTEMGEAVARNLEFIHGEKGLDDEGKAWEFLGILPPGQRLKAQIVSVESSGAKGVFDLTTGRILLSEKFDQESVPDRSLLIRLLGQQLSLQNHPRKSWKSRDEWQAWQAVHVGAAAAMEARFLKRAALANQAGWGNPEPAREELLRNLAPALGGFCNFPFLEGSNYARFHFAESVQRFTEMFRNPPETTREILYPGQEVSVSDGIEKPAELSDAEVAFSNNLGELGVRLWLDPFIGNEEAEQLASNWGADRYFLVKETASLSIIWQFRGREEAMTSNFAEVIREQVLPELKALQPDRKLEIRLRENLITLTNTPKPK